MKVDIKELAGLAAGAAITLGRELGQNCNRLNAGVKESMEGQGKNFIKLASGRLVLGAASCQVV